MKLHCIHCGQPIEIKAGESIKQARCLACGKTTLVPGGHGAQSAPAENRAAPKSRTKDAVILILSLLVVALLAWLLFRPESGARRLVFGDLGSKPSTQSEGGAPEAQAASVSSGQGAGVTTLASPGTQPGDGSASGGTGVPADVPAGQGTSTAGGKVVAGETAQSTGLEKVGDSQPDAAAPNGGIAPVATPTGKAPTAASRGLAAPPSGGIGGPTSVTPGDINAAAGAGTVPQTSQPGSAVGKGPPQTGTGGAAATSSNAREPSGVLPPTPGSVAPTAPKPTAPSPTANPLLGYQNTPGTPAIPSQPIAPPLEVAKESTSDLLTAETKPPGPPAQAAESPGEKTGGPKDAPTPPPTNSKPPGDPANAGGGESGGVDKKEKPPEQEPQVFDPLRGTNVMFILDRSLSMRGQKSARARHELLDALDKLGPNKTFYVIFFPYEPMPASGPLPATQENIRAITNWLFSLDHAFGSDPTQSVERGLALKPDTIWLLSDGSFSSKVAEAIRAANAFTKARIHTVGLYDRGGEQIMRKISEENGGTFRFVPPPGLPPGTTKAAPAASPQ